METVDSRQIMVILAIPTAHSATAGGVVKNPGEILAAFEYQTLFSHHFTACLKQSRIPNPGFFIIELLPIILKAKQHEKENPISLACRQETKPQQEDNFKPGHS
jgi:hypothetical protein